MDVFLTQKKEAHWRSSVETLWSHHGREEGSQFKNVLKQDNRRYCYYFQH